MFSFWSLPRSDTFSTRTTTAYVRQHGLTRFLEDARIPLGSNPVERALRGVVLGRKSHYGSRSHRGTEVAAVFYSLLESAKLCDIEPKDYLLSRLLLEGGARNSQECLELDPLGDFAHETNRDSVEGGGQEQRGRGGQLTGASEL
ncbi:IS66 family transposase [Myxococcus xanthus]|uniref:IS66 family transposase n=1 Tax=Myxococcus xanthus TaxID=34 RepID=UPI001163713B|nr:transposase [Myxococcus xanthus]QDE99008.1 hypothetical protein BHS05_25985 [Myxococcus xanthus]